MAGLVNGIYKICDAAQPVLTAVLILMLLIMGVETIIGGADSHVKFKESIKWLLIGSAIAFGASALGKEIMSWFM
ncbi:MAG: hypothetical protein VB023_04440 [Oscillibacter sp.]|nr:hypothetical protein [Oscillibacter sp.]